MIDFEAIIPTMGDDIEKLADLSGYLVWVNRCHLVYFIGRGYSEEFDEDNFRACTRCIKQISNGCGNAYREGISHVSAEYTLLMDSDEEMHLPTIELMKKKIEETDCDLVVASRWMKGSIVDGYDPTKKILNNSFNFIFKRALGTEIEDLTFSFKMIRTSLLKELEPLFQGERQDFNAESTMYPIARGAKVEQVPTVWRARNGSPTTLKVRSQFPLFMAAGLRALAMKVQRQDWTK